jgi:hypothetical protein
MDLGGLPMASDHIRASDADRDAVAGVLKDAYTAGRITLEEFDERTTAVFTSKTWGDLRELTRDLPEKADLGADLPQPPLLAAPKLDADRVMVPPSRPPRRSRLAPILVIWIIAGLASHSFAVAGVLVLVGIVALLAGAFQAGWRGDDEEDRNSHR